MGTEYTATFKSANFDGISLLELTNIDYDPPLKKDGGTIYSSTMLNGRVLNRLKDERDSLPEGDSLRVVVDRYYAIGLSRIPQRVALLRELREEGFEVEEE
jgi:hypothetical protein